MAFSGPEYNNTYLQILPYELQEEIEHEVQRYNFNKVLAVMMREIKNDNTISNYMICSNGCIYDTSDNVFTKYQVLLNDIMTIVSRTGMYNDNTINFIHTHSVFREILFWVKMVYSLKFPIALEHIQNTVPVEIGEEDIGQTNPNQNMSEYWWRVPICSRGHQIEDRIANLQRYRWPPWGPKRTISPYHYFEYIEKVILMLEYMELLSLHKYLTSQYNSQLVVIGVNMY